MAEQAADDNAANGKHASSNSKMGVNEKVVEQTSPESSLENDNSISTNQEDTTESLSQNTADKQKQLVECWQKIYESLKDQGPRIGAVLQMANPHFMDDNIIKLKVTVESQQELYQKFEQKIIAVLRKTFNNNQLIFEFEIDERVADSNRPMSLAEQYKALLDENPAMETLRKTFDLDI